MKIYELKKAEYPLWDQFIKRNEFLGGIFNTSAYFSLITEIFNCQMSIYIIKANKEIKAGVCILYKRSNYFKFKIQIIPKILLPYNFIFVEPSTSKYLSKRESHHFKFITPLIDYLESKFEKILFFHSWSYYDVRPFIWRNFKQKVNYSYVLKLQKFEYNNLSESLKRWIKKGSNSEFEIAKAINDKNIESCYYLLLKTYNKHNNEFPISKTNFKNFLNSKALCHHLSLYVAYYNDRPASCIILINERKTVYSLLHGNDPKYYNCGIGSTLIFKVMEIKKNAGYSYFDFLGFDGKALAKYKAGYNCELLPSYEVIKSKQIYNIICKIKKLLKG